MSTLFKLNITIAIESIKEIISLDAPVLPTPRPKKDEDYLRLLKSKYAMYTEIAADLKESLETATRDLHSWGEQLTSLKGAKLDTENESIEEFKTQKTPEAILSKGTSTMRTYKAMLNSIKYEIDTIADKLNIEGPAPTILQQNAQPLPVSQLKLPTLELQKFDGHSWCEWWDNYRNSVHEHPGIPDIQKMSHLKSLLTGNAAALLAGLQITEANYAIAIDILKNNFGKNESIIRNLHSELLNLKKCQNLSEMKAFSITLERITRQLANMGHASHTESPQVFLNLESKLYKPMLRDLILEKNKTVEWNTSAFRKTLTSLIEREEQIKQIDSQHTDRTDRNDRTVKKSLTPGKKSNENRPQQIAFSATDRNRELQFSRGRVGPSGTNNRNFGPSNTRGPAPQVSQRPEFRPALTDRPIYRPNQPQGPQMPCRFCNNRTHWDEDCPNYKTSYDRKKRAQAQGRCPRCLATGHTQSQCRGSAKRCFHCSGTHNRAVCGDKYSDVSTATAVQTLNDIQGTKLNGFPLPDLTASSFVKTNMRLMMCTKAAVFNTLEPDLQKEILVFFDIGSCRTFITDDLARALNLQKGPKHHNTLKVFGDPIAKQYPTTQVEIGLRGIHEDIIIDASTIGHMVSNLDTVSLKDLDQLELRNQQMSLPIVTLKPDLLIGVDHFWKFNPVRTQMLPSGFALVSTSIGAIISGQGNARTSTLPTSTYAVFSPTIVMNTVSDVPFDHSEATDDGSLHELVHRYFQNEHTDLDVPDRQTEDRQVLESFESSILFKDGRYEVGLPWKEEVQNLPTNFGLAYGRLVSTLKKLSSRPDLLQKYHDSIMELVSLGIIEPVKLSDKITGPLHYLPHQHVLRADKPDKIRIVYDASSRVNTSVPCLNDCLHKGPKILNDLTGIILRFRMKQNVVICDIEKAFLQISVKSMDRDATRFLWINNLSNIDAFLDSSSRLRFPGARPQVNELGRTKPSSYLITYRFKRVTFGLVCSPFLLAATIQHHLKRYASNPLASKIVENLYVDNILVDTKTESEIPNICRSLQKIFAKAGTKLREFVSNVPSQLSFLDANDRLSPGKAKVLGLKWNPESDEIFFSVPPFSSNMVTKRSVLAFIATPFDPLGIFSPIFLSAKNFVARLWETEYGWDDKLLPALVSEWNAILEMLIDFKISVPRKVTIHGPAPSIHDFSLHVFSDASIIGIGIAFYLRVQSKDLVTSNIIFARSLIIPKKLKNSVPRLELHASHVAAKLIDPILRQMKLENCSTTLYTDSKCVIDWLRSPQKQGRYIDNRVAVIRKYNVLHVIGTQNPADMASRGLKPQEITDNAAWFHGPQWLVKPEHARPIPLLSYEPGEETAREKQVNPPSFFESSNAAAGRKLTALIDLSRFSCWMKLKRSTAYVFRFLKTRHRQIMDTPIQLVELEFRSIVDRKSITVPELQNAERILFREAQILHPPDETMIHQLVLVQHQDKLWRCKGRLDPEVQNPTLPPIYIPRVSQLLPLILIQMHQQLHHAGPSILLAEFRRRFWTPQARKLIRDVIYLNRRTKCGICARSLALPYTLPKEPSLPYFRVQQAPPFTNTGIDYFGPIMTKMTTHSLVDTIPPAGTAIHAKVWGVIFTCLVTRGIHLEIAMNCTADRFLSCFRRFAARRGFPKLVLSDNGTQFVAGAKAIDKIWNDMYRCREVQDFMINRNITWKFITERAPWRGGAYERLIGILKKSLRATIGRKVFPFDDLFTLFTEVELTVNSRPLTYINDAEHFKPLTPLDFLCPLSQQMPLSMPTEEAYEGSNRDIMLNKYEQSLASLVQFWRHWEIHYLPNLRNMHKTLHNRKSEFPKVGDVVLIKDDGPRMHWKIARVGILEPNRDGHIRTAKVYTSDKKVVRRSISHLFPLEVELDESNEELIPEPRPVDDIVHPETPDVPLEPRLAPSLPIRQSERLKTITKSNYRKMAGLDDEVWVYLPGEEFEENNNEGKLQTDIGGPAPPLWASRNAAEHNIDDGEVATPALQIVQGVASSMDRNFVLSDAWNLDYTCDCRRPSVLDMMDACLEATGKPSAACGTMERFPQLGYLAIPNLMFALTISAALRSVQLPQLTVFLNEISTINPTLPELTRLIALHWDALRLKTMTWTEQQFNAILKMWMRRCSHRTAELLAHPQFPLIVENTHSLRGMEISPALLDCLTRTTKRISGRVTDFRVARNFPQAMIVKQAKTVLFGDAFKASDWTDIPRTLIIDVKMDEIKANRNVFPGQYFFSLDVRRVLIWFLPVPGTPDPVKSLRDSLARLGIECHSFVPTNEAVRRERIIKRIREIITDSIIQCVTGAVIEPSHGSAPIPKARPSVLETDPGTEEDRVSAQIIEYDNSNAPDPERYESVRKRIQGILREINFRDVKLHGTGSAAAGLAVCSSDFDFCLRCSDNEKPARWARTARNRLRRWMRGPDGYVTDAFLITTRRLTLLHLRLHDLTPIDLTVGGSMVGVQNTIMLHMFTRFDSRFRPVVIIAKKWAKTVRIIDSQRGGLNSYCFTLLLVHYFQRRKILPPLNDERLLVEGINVDAASEVFRRAVDSIGTGCCWSGDDSSVAALLCGFLTDLHQMDWLKFSVDVRTGQFERNELHHAINVPEPYDSKDNCARTAESGLDKRIRRESKKWLTEIKRTGDLGLGGRHSEGPAPS